MRLREKHEATAKREAGSRERWTRLPLPWLTFLFFFGILSARFVYDGDIFWHIATGHWIQENLSIPSTDPFSYTVRGQPWIAHEWLAALVFSISYGLGGWTLIAVLTAVCAALAYAIILRELLTRLQPTYAVPLTALSFFLSLHHFLLRPHVLVMPLLVLWCGKLVKCVDQRQHPPLRYIALLWIWANLHGSVTFGLAVAALLGCEAVMEGFRSGDVGTPLRGWSRFLVASLAASMLTPLGYQAILFPSLLYGHPFLLDTISEWRSPDFHEPQALEFWLLFFIGFALTRGLKVPGTRLLFLVILIHMALHHIRHVAILGLISPLLLSDSLARQGGEKNKGPQGPHSFNAWCQKLPTKGTVKSAFFASALFAALTVATALRHPAPTAGLGVFRAIEVAKQNGVQGNVLNGPGFGGPLIFSGIAPFIDGRLDLYGDEFLRQYLAAINLTNARALPELLDRFAICWTVFDPGRPLQAWMEMQGDWRRIYEDPDVIVHVRHDNRTGKQNCHPAP